MRTVLKAIMGSGEPDDRGDPEEAGSDLDDLPDLEEDNVD